MGKGRTVLIALVALLVAAAGGFQLHNSYASGVSKVTTKTVKATEKSHNYIYAPKTITIHKGTKVVWANKSDTAHTVTGKGSLSSLKRSLAVGKTVTHVFNKAGTYHYYCTIHPATMKGTIIVM
jgi:plastocyanin